MYPSMGQKLSYIFFEKMSKNSTKIENGYLRVLARMSGYFIKVTFQNVKNAKPKIFQKFRFQLILTRAEVKKWNINSIMVIQTIIHYGSYILYYILYAIQLSSIKSTLYKIHRPHRPQIMDGAFFLDFLFFHLLVTYA